MMKISRFYSTIVFELMVIVINTENKFKQISSSAHFTVLFNLLVIFHYVRKTYTR